MADNKKEMVAEPKPEKVAISGVLSFILGILAPLLNVLTPELRKWAGGFLKDFKAKAALTDNPWDDILADVLCKLFGIE